MFQVLTADQLPEPVRLQSAAKKSIPPLPFESMPPGGAIRIPFDLLPDCPDARRRIHGTLRTRACRAGQKLGVQFSVRQAADAFYITCQASLAILPV